MDLLNKRTNPENLRYPIIHMQGEDIEVALTHGNQYGEQYYSFVNGQNTTQGGTHLNAFKEAVVNTIRGFFNKNYEFDAKANINIITKHKETDNETIVPFLLKNNNYQADLSGFPAGEYDYIVRANNGEVSISGAFQILDYNVEQQFLNANVTKLQQLATNSEGSSYFISNTENLITDLLNDSRYATIQKSTKNVVPLIDFKYLLALIVLSLALEWFIRKYNGLI